MCRNKAGRRKFWLARIKINITNRRKPESYAKQEKEIYLQRSLFSKKRENVDFPLPCLPQIIIAGIVLASHTCLAALYH